MARTGGHRRTIVAFGAVVVLHSVTDKLFGSIYVAAMAERGLSEIGIGLVLSVASAALAAFDYPSGNIADTFGRRNAMSAGFVVWGAGILLYARSMCLWHYLAAIIAWSLGAALISGAPQSWLVDELRARARGELRDRVIPLANGFSLTVGALAASAGGWLMYRGIASPLVVGGWMALATGIVLPALMSENYGDRSVRLVDAVRRNTADLLRSPVARLLLFRSAASRVAFQVFVVSWQLYMVQALGMSMPALGPTLTFLILVVAAGNALAAPAMRRIDPVLVSILGQVGIALGVATIIGRPDLQGFFVGATLFELGLGLDSGASAAWVHDFVPSEQRASFVSAFSAAGSCAGIATPLAVGAFIQFGGFVYSWSLSILSTALTIIILGKLLREKERNDVVTRVEPEPK